MAKWFAKFFYNSIAWKKCKGSYIKSVHGLCERCGKPGYIVHHKEILTPQNINDPNVTLNWEKLEYLCQECHNKEHIGNKKEITREGFSFNEAGELVYSPPIK